MKKIIGIIISVFALVFICLAESLTVENTISNIRKSCNNLYTLANSIENIDTSEIITKTDSLNKYWADREHILCFFINYKDIEKISENILLLLGMNNMQMDEIDSLIVYASFEESIEHCNIKRYDVDFVINKKSAEEWNALGDKEKEDLEFDFSDYTLE